MIAAVSQAGIGGYAVLFAGVAASWIGIPLIGAGALAAAGLLASEGDLNIWIVIAVATAAAWLGGWVGYWLGARTTRTIKDRAGRSQRHRRRAMDAGERIYRRWGPLAVFLTPTWMSGAMRMSPSSFLLWHSVAAVVSTCIAGLGAYGIGTAVLGPHVKQGVVGLAVAAAAIVVVVELRRHTAHGDGRRTRAEATEALGHDDER